MASVKVSRPMWFKFWQRNRAMLDNEYLSLESMGKVFINMMRYFDTQEEELIEMTPLELMAFNTVKVNCDVAFEEYQQRKEINSENGKKGGRPPKTA